MKKLLFDAPAHHILVEGGERIHGGGTFEAKDERALELLTSPALDIVEVPDAVEPVEVDETPADTDTSGPGEPLTETVEADTAPADNVATETDTQREADDGEAHSIEGGTP